MKIKSYTEQHRHLGRTTRMLNHACRESAIAGKYVVVYGANLEHASQLFDQFLKIPNVECAEKTVLRNKIVHFINGGQARFRSIDDTQSLWHGADQRRDIERVELQDHYSIEKRFSKVIDEYHRWDTL